MDAAILDRAIGALVGLAVGDALGTTLEFSARDTSPEHREMTGGGPFRLEPGQWTDDTATALALADSLIRMQRFDAADFANCLVSWWRDGDYSCTGTCFDIGGTTHGALATFERTGEPYSGSTSETSAGNGSIMRLAPTVLFALDDREAMLRLAADQSRVTHGAPQAVDACVILADRLRSSILGTEALAGFSQPRIDPALVGIVDGFYLSKERAEISSSGYVVDTLEAALWAVAKTSTFEDALIRAVNLGDDADTVGAVAGQLAGAKYGLSTIPQRWLAPLAWREGIERTARRLLGQ